MNKHKNIDIIFITLICVSILSMGLLIIMLSPDSFSDKENRQLAGAPDLSASSVLNGDFFEELSLFIKDHFPLRNSLISMHSICELSLGKMQINGIIPSKNQALIAVPQTNDTNKIKANISAIHSSSDNTPLIYVPARSIDIFNQYLPKSYDYSKDASVFSSLPQSSAKLFEDLLRNAENGYYYKTDHHWTTEGAFFAYNQICKELGLTAYDKKYFSKEIVSRNFRGTSYSKSGLPEMAADAEDIFLYRYANDNQAKVFNHETGESKKGFYDYEALTTSDKYRVFLGGNYSHLSISLDDSAEKPKLLLVKDSFANSLIPFLALHYDIEAIDPRYCSSSYLDEQLKREDFDSTLVLLSFDTLAQININ